MPRRTPIIAIVLAPIALYILVGLWNHVAIPLYRSIWYGDTVLQMRLASDEPAVRMGALKDVTVAASLDAQFIDKIATLAESDASLEVRKSAARALGHIGAKQALPDTALRALSELVLTADDHALLANAVVAVGQSAAESGYSDQVVERIARVFDDKQLISIYLPATETLGQLGAAQALPAPVFDRMNAVFTNDERRGERQNLAAAFAEIAKRRPLPAATIDVLIATLAEEENSWVHVQVIYALGHMATDHPEALPVIAATTNHARKEVRSAAEQALRIMEHKRTFGEREPLAMARNRSQSIEARLTALRIIKGTRIDAGVYDDIVALATDEPIEIRIAALGLFHYLARSPGDDFDQRVLNPTLIKSMSDTEPKVREAAVGALSTISMHRKGYHYGDQTLNAQLEASIEDAEPKVRVLALVVKVQSNAGSAVVDEVINRGLDDPDPYVRGNAVGWLSSDGTSTNKREAFFKQALQDPNAHVRAAAAKARETWKTRKRSWPLELWKTWRAGDYGKVGLVILTTVTVAAPVAVCIIFLLYVTARLLTYLFQRRWRAVTLVSVFAIWAAASYAMFMLFFAAGHAGHMDAGEIAVLAGALWAAIAVYAGLGWGMHYAVRR